MKILILSLFITLNLFAQSSNLLLLMDAERVYIYNGTELITNAIDRALEPITSVYASDFSAGVNGWSIDGGVTIDGNIDAIGGEDNTLRMTSDGATTPHVSRRLSTTTAGVMYKMTFKYYILSTNVKAVKMTMRDGSGQVIGIMNSTKDSWVSTGGKYLCAQTNIRSYALDNSENLTFAGNAGDLWYVKDVKLSAIPYYVNNGNHSIDSSSVYKQAGTYSGIITASAAGNGTTNTISLASTRFTAVTSGLNYRFQVYAYTSTANTTLTFKLGDIVKTAIVPTTGMSVLNFDFKATASSTGNILLYLDKAATVYIDNISLKSGQ